MKIINVKYTGTFRDPSGYGAANRAYITALYVAGAQVTTELVTQTHERSVYGWEEGLSDTLMDRNIPYKIKIIHLTPDLYEQYREKGKYHIGHLFWETSRIPKEWVMACNQMNEIWTADPTTSHSLRISGVRVPIYEFPQPMDSALSYKDFGEFSFPYEDKFVFYSIFQWIARKNPKALVTAYWDAFKGNNNVVLLLKTFRTNYNADEFVKIEQEIALWKTLQKQSHYPKILLITQLMSHEEIMRLHQTGDCFVQTDCGEGWSRTMHEALISGKPAITTYYGGIRTYLDDNHYYKVMGERVQAHQDYYSKFYTPDQTWIDIDKEQLKKNMLFVYNNPVISRARGLEAREFVRDKFSYHVVGFRMFERLLQINEGLK